MTKRSVIVAATLIIATALMIAVAVAITSYKTFHTTGTITGVNLFIYSDEALSQPLDPTHPMAWGSVAPGDHVDKTVYIVNTGTTAMTVNLSLSNWVEQNDLTIGWDKEGATVQPGVANKVTAILTLTASSGFTTGADFSVDITITGTH